MRVTLPSYDVIHTKLSMFLKGSWIVFGADAHVWHGWHGHGTRARMTRVWHEGTDDTVARVARVWHEGTDGTRARMARDLAHSMKFVIEKKQSLYFCNHYCVY